MIRSRTVTRQARSRPKPSFDSLECRQLLDASPLTRFPVETAVIQQHGSAEVRHEEVHAERAQLRGTLLELRHSWAQSNNEMRSAMAATAGTATMYHSQLHLNGLVSFRNNTPTFVGGSGSIFTPL